MSAGINFHIPYLENININCFSSDFLFEFAEGDCIFQEYCPTMFAEIISRKVSKIRKSDPLMKNYKFSELKKEDLVVFQRFLKSMPTGQFSFTMKEKNSVYRFAKELENVELVNISTPDFRKEIPLKDVIPQLIDKLSFEINPSEEITIIAQNIHKFDYQSLSTLQYEILEKILSNPRLIVPEENWLFEFLLSLIINGGTKYVNLLSFIRFQYVSTDNIEKMLKTIHLNDMGSEVFDALKSRLILPVVTGQINPRAQKTIFNVNPLCSILTYEKAYIYAHFYRCKTCSLVGNYCICENCIKVCHAGHEVIDCGFLTGFCDCGYHLGPFPCLCCTPHSTDPICTRVGKVSDIEQFMYECKTCGIYVCSSCASKCHNTHNLIPYGVKKDTCKCCIKNESLCKCQPVIKK